MGKKYQVLARKYRPQTFAEVVGQGPILTTLKNALQFDQVAHAYLFCGSRGVGKTTLARLFAKALNCSQRGSELEPCNQCPSCQEILAGQSLDVIEIDGASNRGIDDIRQINETVVYAPSHGNYKIYIIDEVHMLTKEAFNALLKTLEEPPEKAKFFFATTEPHKVLPTIISRCQRFDLLRIEAGQISRKLGEIVEDMDRKADLDALDLIASFADGSLRDAESLLDQILCFSPDVIQTSTVRKALGLVPDELFFELDEAFASYRLAYAFELVETLFHSGKDLGYFLEQLVGHYRAICLCKTVSTQSLPAHLGQRYAKSAALYTQPQALYILDLLLTTEPAMQKSPFPRVTLEATLLHIIRSKNRIPIEVITRRLHALEEALKDAGGSLPTLEALQETVAPRALSRENSERPDAAPSVFESAPQASEPSDLELTAMDAAVLEVELPVEELAASPSVFATPPSVQEELNPETEQPSPLFIAPSVFAQNQDSPSLSRHASYYETMMRFAAVELEGTLKI